MKSLFFFFLASCAFCLSNSEYICPPCCFCPGDGFVYCNNCDLTSVPPNLPLNATSVDLSDNNIKHVARSDLSYLTNLTYFSISGNGIDEDGLSQAGLQYMRNLISISLGQNNFRSVPPYLPKGVTYLNMDDNKIIDLGSAIQTYSKLETLSLQSNDIVSLPSFASNPDLGYLVLAFNKITSFESSTVRQNTVLTDLDLRFNMLDTIHPDSFVNQEKLQMLLLDNNRLTTDTINAINFDNLKEIQNFSLSGNPLTEIPKNMPKYVINLQLSNTSITTIPAGTFKDAKFVRIQWLFLNALNKLQIEAGAFHGLDTLMSLAISQTRITPGVISPGMLEGLSQLQVLTLFNSSVGGIEVGAFQDTPNISQIQLFYNQIATLDQQVFAGLTKLWQLWLNFNPFWCDCHLRWLKEASQGQHRLLIIDPHSMQCEGPGSNQGKMFGDLSPDDFVCS